MSDCSCFVRLLLFCQTAPVLSDCSCFVRLILFCPTAPVLSDCSCFVRLLLFCQTDPVLSDCSCFVRLLLFYRTVPIQKLSKSSDVSSFRCFIPTIPLTMHFSVCNPHKIPFPPAMPGTTSYLYRYTCSVTSNSLLICSFSACYTSRLPPRHRFFSFSLCPKANAQTAPNIPSCHYMLLM